MDRSARRCAVRVCGTRWLAWAALAGLVVGCETSSGTEAPGPRPATSPPALGPLHAPPQPPAETRESPRELARAEGAATPSLEAPVQAQDAGAADADAGLERADGTRWTGLRVLFTVARSGEPATVLAEPFACTDGTRWLRLWRCLREVPGRAELVLDDGRTVRGGGWRRLPVYETRAIALPALPPGIRWAAYASASAPSGVGLAQCSVARRDRERLAAPAPEGLTRMPRACPMLRDELRSGRARPASSLRLDVDGDGTEERLALTPFEPTEPSVGALILERAGQSWVIDVHDSTEEQRCGEDHRWMAFDGTCFDFDQDGGLEALVRTGGETERSYELFASTGGSVQQVGAYHRGD